MVMTLRFTIRVSQAVQAILLREAACGGYFFFAAELAATAARMSCLKEASSIFSPSRRSIARRVLPSRLELKRFFGSSMEAPRKKVSFTTCLYDSPVQTPPSCDQTGVPPDVGFSHFHSSWMSGSASWISCRTRARVSPRQSPSSSIRSVILSEAASAGMREYCRPTASIASVAVRLNARRVRLEADAAIDAPG